MDQVWESSTPNVCFQKNQARREELGHLLFACFLHRFAGDTGNNLLEWIRFLVGNEWKFPHIKVIIPTAPSQPYTPLDGQVI